VGAAAEGRHRRRSARLRQRPELLRQLQGGDVARKYFAGSRDDDSQLVRELASERGTGFGLIATPGEVETGTIEALEGAAETLRSKAPDELEAYRSFVLALAESVGKAAGGGDQAEAAAVEKIKAALG
jgi:hypothetical protein